MTFAAQCSVSPPRFTRDAAELARLFGSRSGFDVDKFSLRGWHSGPRGLPLPATSGGPQLGFQDVRDLPLGTAA
ncbi:hypothetical protein ABZU76_14275 [Amycolatopsis sp. NPDC005232]|uniref:hypothetical protein n=1 Tax=Amycolatopsis sp. NPDC005232 TaxID=3157027 RepID=UPI0033A399B1